MSTGKALLGIHLFNGITAVAGGIGLMGGGVTMQPEWMTHTQFTSGYVPGVVLFAIVGGSALLAALGLHKRVEGAHLASLLAGLAMVLWIVGEIASIRAFHVLQVLYLVTGAAAVLLTPRTQAPAGADQATMTVAARK